MLQAGGSGALLIPRLTHGWPVPDQHDDDPGREDAPDDAPPARVLRAAELFGDRREVWIELDGVRYRLRITRRGKLILQK
jgi:hemin uptake protein HemP